jgi:GMP synthase-like glutamine amidotransferase
MPNPKHPARTTPPQKLRVCLCDMNNGHPNQAMRCFRVIISAFFAAVRRANPGLECELAVVEPRNKHELPPRDCDLYISSGGPGTPYEHDGEVWLDEMYSFYDWVVERRLQLGPGGPSLLGVCYTYELLVRHFRVGGVEPLSDRKFGVMPVYTTADGQAHPLTQAFGDRLFAFEHRNWEAIDVDEGSLRAIGGRVLARESRDGVSKGRAVLALHLAPGIEGTQFHPEADRPGVIAWVSKREQAQAFVKAYGRLTYDRMIKTLDDPQRLAKTFALMIPGWLTRQFNELAGRRGWAPLPLPELDMVAFAGGAPPAASVRHDDIFDDDAV